MLSDYMAVVIYPTTYFLIEPTDQSNRWHADATLDFLTNPTQERLDTDVVKLFDTTQLSNFS